MSPFLLQTSPQNTWVIYGAAAMGGFYILLRYVSKKKKKDPLADAPVRFSLSQHKSVERDMQNLLVELADMSRQITAQIDTRAAKLDALIREADEKIAELRALSDGQRNIPAGRSYDTYRLPMTPASIPAAVTNTDDPRHAAVYQLADQGKSSPQIAAELGRAKGEIELILALRGQKQG